MQGSDLTQKCADPQVSPLTFDIDLLPNAVRELITLDDRLLWGDRVAAGPRPETYLVLDHGEPQTFVYCCALCREWIDVLLVPKLPERWRRSLPDTCNDCRDLDEWRRRHPIRSSTARERPKMRRVIVERDLRPWPSPSSWDGFSCWGQDNRRSFLSDNLKKQMRLMFAQGYFSRPQDRST